MPDQYAFANMIRAKQKQQRLAMEYRRKTVSELWVLGMNRAEIWRAVKREGIHSATYTTICRDVKAIRAQLREERRCRECGRQLPLRAKPRKEYGGPKPLPPEDRVGYTPSPIDKGTNPGGEESAHSAGQQQRFCSWSGGEWGDGGRGGGSIK